MTRAARARRRARRARPRAAGRRLLRRAGSRTTRPAWRSTTRRCAASRVRRSAPACVVVLGASACPVAETARLTALPRGRVQRAVRLVRQRPRRRWPAWWSATPTGDDRAAATASGSRAGPTMVGGGRGACRASRRRRADARSAPLRLFRDELEDHARRGAVCTLRAPPPGLPAPSRAAAAWAPRSATRAAVAELVVDPIACDGPWPVRRAAARAHRARRLGLSDGRPIDPS